MGKAEKKVVIDRKQILLAAKVIIKVGTEIETTDITKEKGYITLHILMSEVPKRGIARPLLVEIPHGLYSKDANTQACLFVKDP